MLGGKSPVTWLANDQMDWYHILALHRSQSLNLSPIYQKKLFSRLGINNSKLQCRNVWFHNRTVFGNHGNHISIDGHSTGWVVITRDKKNLFAREIGDLHLDVVIH